VNDHSHANRSAWAVLLLTINQHGAKFVPARGAEGLEESHS
jgi:hypothetical protein